MKCEIVIPIITELSVLIKFNIFWKNQQKEQYRKHVTTNIQLMTSDIEQSVLFPLVLNIINWTVIVKYA